MKHACYQLSRFSSRTRSGRKGIAALALGFLALGSTAYAQPVISSLSTSSGIPGSSVTISGSGFNGTAANNAVYFGATRGTVSSASGTSLTVSVPAGASREPVTVTNLSTGLSGASQYPFLPTFNNPYTPALNMGSHADYYVLGRPWNIRAADLDGDGKTDLLVGMIDGPKIIVYRNESNGDVNSGSFVYACEFNTGYTDLAISDMDGDGKKDILIAQTNSIQVIRNNATVGSLSSSSFEAPVSVNTASGTGSGWRMIAVGDIDGDGKPDIVSTRDYGMTTGASGHIAIFRNASSSGSITSSSFAAPVVLSTYTQTMGAALLLTDIDGDGKVDIVGGRGDGVVVMRNTSAGAITSSSFSSPIIFATASSYIYGLAAADIDGDGKQDVVTLHTGPNVTSVFRNTATSGSITSSSMAARVDISISGTPTGLSLEDMTGDGKADVVYSYYTSRSYVGILTNTATSGTITTGSFAASQSVYAGVVYAYSSEDQYPGPPVVVDINGDARPDITFGTGTMNFSAIQNQIPRPVVSLSSSTAVPGTSLTITGSNFSTTAANNLVYFGATRATVTGASSSSLTVTVPTGSTYAPVSVTNSVTAERGSSAMPFSQTYDHSAFPAGAIGFDGQVDIPNGGAASGPIIKDMDGDGKPDVFSNGTFFRNVATPGTVSSSSYAASSPVSYLPDEIEDIDGDGKPDIITRTLTGFQIRRNISTAGTLDASSFAAPVSITTPATFYHFGYSSHSGTGFTVGDMDGDGKPDIVAGINDDAVVTGVVVIRNSCTPGNIASNNFDPIIVPVHDLTSYSTDNIVLSDLNGDGLLDIMARMESGAWPSQSVRILKNTSQRGFLANSNYSISFVPVSLYASFEIAGEVIGDYAVPADIDGDGKIDLAVPNINTHSLNVFRNTSSATTISFASPATFALDNSEEYYRPTVGDFDGDGKIDIVVGGPDFISVFRNTATSGTINSSSLAARQDFPTTVMPYQPFAVDVDGDHRPEIVFGTPNAPKWSILRNNPAAIYGDATVCTGSTSTLSDFVTGGTWTSSNSAVAAIGSSTGVVAGIAVGTAVISYEFPGGGATTIIVTVNPSPSSISGTINLCQGGNATLTNSTPSGSWSSSNTNVSVEMSMGTIIGAAAGTATITYKLYATGCLTTAIVTVNPTPAAISGSVNVCVGGTGTMSNTTAGGVWTSGSPAIASADAASGIVTGMAPGTAIISYTLSSGCFVTKVATVGPTLPAIAGSSGICTGLTTSLSNSIGGGTWSSSDVAVATVGSTGVVAAVAVGPATISYTVSSVCGIAVVTKDITVNATPAAITGTTSLCQGQTTTLASASPGGIWISLNTSVATVGSATGVVTGVAGGTANIRYILSYATGGCFIQNTATVNSLPAAIGGGSSVLVGSTLALSHSGTGTWSSSNAAVATVGTSGVVTGVSAGTAAISWTAITGCFVTKTVTVNSSILGSLSISGAGTTTLSSSTPGGTWSTACGAIATINDSGVVTGVSNGLATITYTTGSGYSTAVVTVSMTYSLLNGYGVACQSRTAEFIPPVGGGTWSSANTSIATTGTSGVWTGVAAGTTTISYSFGSGCASTKQVTVNPLSGYEAITVAPICEGAMGNAFPDAGEAYGDWISSDSSKVIAGQYFLGGSTSVLGVSSGTATLTHIPLPMFSCPITYASTVVTVMPSPAPITGPGTVAVGAQITLSETSTGGFWTALNPKATVDSFSGVVTGVAAGGCSIYYTWSNGCSRAKGVTVTASAAISGTLSVCEGATTTLSHVTSGGTWSSGNSTVAMIGSSSGVVSGVSAGTSAITYTYSGGTAVVVVTVNAFPTAGSIGGASTLCVASTATLSATVSGGSWSSSDATTAAVSAGGVITGMAMGTVTISYAITNSCGSAVATTAVTVNPLPAAGSVTGAASVAVGSSITLSNSTTGGTWSASNGNATVNSAGVVTGVTAGTVTISYSVTSSCGTAVATKLITVNEEASLTISGPLTVCVGATTALGSSISGGTWSSGDMTIATVFASGVVTGVSAGVAAITYTTATASATVNVTVTATPAITGVATLCPGTTITLSGGSTGGTWTGGSTVVATVGSTGIVTGIATGTTNFTYSTGSACNATIQVTVNSAPSSITGTFKACPGTSTALSSMTPGGSWSTGDATIATAGASTGIISGIAAGTVTVTYTTGVGCYRTVAYTVNPAPAAIAGSMLICAGSTTTLTDATPGLSWTSGNTAVATVGATGVVNGLSNGMATITYTAASTNCITTAEVTVNGVPASIAGPATGCVGWDIALTNSVPGGVWSSSNVATATVDPSTGVVTGVASGIVTITYTTGAGCYKTKQITINNSPAVTGYPTACVGLTTTLSGGASGTWSSSTPAVATIVTSGGYVTGVSAGTSTMTFTSTGTGCRATYVVSVIPVPSAITGPTQACTGAVLALTNSTPGGVWTSANTANATVGSATGITTIVGTGGSVTISYSFGNNCRATKAISLKPLPAVINGSPTVCTPVTTTLSTVTSGGTWTSSDASVATVGTAISASYGLVTGVSAGTAEITYTITTTGCARSTVVTVNAGLNPGTITSSGGFTLHTVSPLTSVTLSSTGASGGTWTSSNSAVATINPSTGLVTAVAAGTTTITYAVTASCTNITTKVITVTAGRPAGSNPAVDNVQLYPNPTAGSFTLVSEEAGTLHVFSIDGKGITSFEVKAGINPLSLPIGIAPGIYMCRYTSENGNTTMVRLVVE